MGDRIKLNDGHEMPVLAFGTWQIPKETIPEVLQQALDVGYRHIDTAQAYGNEEAIGQVLADWFAQGKLTRDQVFVTTKLWGTHLGKDDVAGAVAGSLRKLQLDHVDLMLIHTPCGMKNHGDGTVFPKDKDGKLDIENYDLMETWKALEKCVSEGKIRSIGFSNFNSVQTDLINFVSKVKPVLNQVECHAYLPQNELHEFCQKRNITMQAYAPLASPGRPESLVSEGEPVLVEETILKSIGDTHGKTPAQVLIRYLLQRGIPVVSKSCTPSRITEDFQVFDFNLSADEMAALGKLKTNHRFFCFSNLWADHPQYPFNIAF